MYSLHMLRFHGEKSVWPIVKNRVRKAKKSQQLFVAIAYVGAGATKILPLRRGDVLVCNASDAAIKQGSTSAEALERFLHRGVKIFNEPRLHGKVVVFPGRAFVGSANASSRSRDVLYEAVLETTDPQVVAHSQRFVERHARQISRLRREDVERLLKIRVKRITTDDSSQQPQLSKMKLPKQVPLLRILPVVFDLTSKAVEKEISKARKDIRANFFDGGLQANIEAEQWDSSWWDQFRQEMWYVGVTKSGRMYKPRKVIKLSKVTKHEGIAWLANPTDGKSFVKNPKLLLRIGFDWSSDTGIELRSAKTESLLRLFRD
jgi:hypothetical protein